MVGIRSSPLHEGGERDSQEHTLVEREAVGKKRVLGEEEDGEDDGGGGGGGDGGREAGEMGVSIH